MSATTTLEWMLEFGKRGICKFYTDPATRDDATKAEFDGAFEEFKTKAPEDLVFPGIAPGAKGPHIVIQPTGRQMAVSFAGSRPLYEQFSMHVASELASRAQDISDVVVALLSDEEASVEISDDLGGVFDFNHDLDLYIFTRSLVLVSTTKPVLEKG